MDGEGGDNVLVLKTSFSQNNRSAVWNVCREG